MSNGVTITKLNRWLFQSSLKFSLKLRFKVSPRIFLREIASHSEIGYTVGLEPTGHCVYTQYNGISFAWVMSESATRKIKLTFQFDGMLYELKCKETETFTMTKTT